MDPADERSLHVPGGEWSLTETHLQLVKNGYLAESLALKHVSAVVVDQAQSFRHRTLGLFVGIALLTPGVAIMLPEGIAESLAVRTFFRGRVAIGVFFAAFFGILFLWGVVTSRRIWWLRLRYGKTPKSFPLPGVESESVLKFAQVVRQASGEKSKE